uniref:RING-type E3 ubiquitin transferase n=1 Tax=Nelumbo nucifera TaxID=4432 RepID=A0A822XEP3_NELNU|nr:TPA_asm: hypothetical protein HUJ06_019576 [Nelumbo nucifera]
MINTGIWRLDVDNMTYEELLELGGKIGYVNTSLREDEIFHCLRKLSTPLWRICNHIFPLKQIGNVAFVKKNM